MCEAIFFYQEIGKSETSKAKLDLVYLKFFRFLCPVFIKIDDTIVWLLCIFSFSFMRSFVSHFHAASFIIISLCKIPGY